MKEILLMINGGIVFGIRRRFMMSTTELVEKIVHDEVINAAKKSEHAGTA